MSFRSLRLSNSEKIYAVFLSVFCFVAFNAYAGTLRKPKKYGYNYATKYKSSIDPITQHFCTFASPVFTSGQDATYAWINMTMKCKQQDMILYSCKSQVSGVLWRWDGAQGKYVQVNGAGVVDTTYTECGGVKTLNWKIDKGKYAPSGTDMCMSFLIYDAYANYYYDPYYNYFHVD